MATMTECSEASNGGRIMNMQTTEPFCYNKEVEVFRDREYPMLKGW